MGDPRVSGCLLGLVIFTRRVLILLRVVVKLEAKDLILRLALLPLLS